MSLAANLTSSGSQPRSGFYPPFPYVVRDNLLMSEIVFGCDNWECVCYYYSAGRD